MPNRLERHSVGVWLFILMLACAVFCGAWLNSNARRAHPIMYLNLGAAYLEEGRVEKAKHYWWICSHYEQVYGPVNQHEKTFIEACKHNLIRASVKIDKNDPLFKRGR